MRVFISIGMQTLIEDIVNKYAHSNSIIGIALSGSVNKGFYDDVSDVDFFIYLENKALLTIQYISENFQIVNSDITQKVYNIEQNYYYSGRFINVKFFSFEFIKSYLEMPFQWEDIFLEQVENIISMKTLHDPHNRLRRSQEACAKCFFQEKPRLLKEMLDRYGNLFWRSVYQCVYRDEKSCARLMLDQALNLFVKLAYMQNNILPPPVKWRLNKNNLSQIIGGSKLLELVELFEKVDWRDKIHLLFLYEQIRETELEILRSPQKGWWWNVFEKNGVGLVSSPHFRDFLEKIRT